MNTTCSARVSHALAKAGAQVEDWDDDATKVKHVPHRVRSTGQRGWFRPAFDLADVGDFDAVVAVIDRKVTYYDQASSTN